VSDKGGKDEPTSEVDPDFYEDLGDLPSEISDLEDAMQAELEEDLDNMKLFD
jgi:hypothetical protein